jgi:hypothetical protein
VARSGEAGFALAIAAGAGEMNFRARDSAAD